MTHSERRTHSHTHTDEEQRVTLTDSARPVPLQQQEGLTSQEMITERRWRELQVVWEEGQGESCRSLSLWLMTLQTRQVGPTEWRAGFSSGQSRSGWRTWRWFFWWCLFLVMGLSSAQPPKPSCKSLWVCRFYPTPHRVKERGQTI